MNLLQSQYTIEADRFQQQQLEKLKRPNRQTRRRSKRKRNSETEKKRREISTANIKPSMSTVNREYLKENH